MTKKELTVIALSTNYSSLALTIKNPSKNGRILN